PCNDDCLHAPVRGDAGEGCTDRIDRSALLEYIEQQDCPEDDDAHLERGQHSFEGSGCNFNSPHLPAEERNEYGNDETVEYPLFSRPSEYDQKEEDGKNR